MAGGAVQGPPGLVCRLVRSADQQADHFAIRHEVFVQEQQVFDSSDRDPRDGHALTLALLGYCDGRTAGTVRLFPLEGPDRVWQGDRLAVLPAYRTRGIGAPLVRCAVATAALMGGRRMSAHIQLANVTYFMRLGWTRTGDAETYAGLPHQPMSIILPVAEEAAATLRDHADDITPPVR